MKPVLWNISFFFVKLLSLLPLRILYLFSNVLFFIAFYIIKYRKNVIIGNLKNAFPEKSEIEIKNIVRKFYSHFCDNLIETVALLSMPEDEIKRRMVYKNVELLNKLYDNKKSVCVVFGHYGNWEWLASLPLSCKHNVFAIYLPLKNKKVDELIKNARSKFGVICIKKQTALYKIFENYKQGKLSITYLLGDQTPNKSELDYWTQFLNQETPVFLGVEKIAIKTGQAVVFFHIRKIKRGYYETEIINLFEDAKSTTPGEITETHVKLLEKIIFEKPEYWLWSHRRWKHKKPVN